MKHILTVLLAVLTLSVIGHLQSVTAQNPDLTPYQFTVVGAHSLCTVSTGQTRYCFASDGVWQSLNGAGYAPLVGGAPTGVTSLNGKTGDLTVSAVAAAPVATTTTTAPAVTVSVK